MQASTAVLFEFFTIKSRKKDLGKISVFPTLSGVSEREANVDTIKIVAERWIIKIDANFYFYTDWLNLLETGGLIYYETRLRLQVRTARFTINRKESPGGSDILITNRFAAKFFSDIVCVVLVFMHSSDRNGFQLRLNIKLKSLIS